MAEPSLLILDRPPGGVDDLARRRESSRIDDEGSAGIDEAEAKLTAEAAEASLRMGQRDERDRERPEVSLRLELDDGRLGVCACGALLDSAC